MGPSPFGSNTQFRHFCWIRIIAQCPDTWGRVHSVHIPNSDIFAWLELLNSVQTHGPESMWLKYLIPTFLLDENCCTVSGHMGPSPFSSNTWFRHFCWIRTVAQCPDTWARVHSVHIPHFCMIRIAAQGPDTWAWVHSAQIPNSDIFAGLELLHSVRTHGPESNWFKYPIPTFLLD